MNIKFCYLYRDAANYKQYNEIIFTNPNDKSLVEIQALIRNNLIDGNWFVAKHWNVPDMHFKEYPWDTDIDHDWHELDSLEETNELSKEKISIEEFLFNVAKKLPQKN